MQRIFNSLNETTNKLPSFSIWSDYTILIVQWDFFFQKQIPKEQ